MKSILTKGSCDGDGSHHRTNSPIRHHGGGLLLSASRTLAMNHTMIIAMMISVLAVFLGGSSTGATAFAFGLQRNIVTSPPTTIAIPGTTGNPSLSMAFGHRRVTLLGIRSPPIASVSSLFLKMTNRESSSGGPSAIPKTNTKRKGGKKSINNNEGGDTDFLKRIQAQTRQRRQPQSPPLAEDMIHDGVSSTGNTLSAASPESSTTTPYEEWFARAVNQRLPITDATAGATTKKMEQRSKQKSTSPTVQTKSKQGLVEGTTSQPPSALASDGDWSAYWDENNTGYIYYFNHMTGQSQWDPPTKTFPILMLSPEMKSLAKQIQEKEKFRRLQPLDGKPRPLAREGDWSAYFDAEGSNMVYYHNAVTGVSQWEKPTATFPVVRLTSGMRNRILVANNVKEENDMMPSFVRSFLQSIEDFFNPPSSLSAAYQDVRKGTILSGTTTDVTPEPQAASFDIIEFVKGFFSVFFEPVGNVAEPSRGTVQPLITERGVMRSARPELEVIEKEEIITITTSHAPSSMSSRTPSSRSGLVLQAEPEPSPKNGFWKNLFNFIPR